jgi:hypothetical protein
MQLTFEEHLVSPSIGTPHPAPMYAIQPNKMYRHTTLRTTERNTAYQNVLAHHWKQYSPSKYIGTPLYAIQPIKMYWHTTVRNTAHQNILAHHCTPYSPSKCITSCNCISLTYGNFRKGTQWREELRFPQVKRPAREADLSAHPVPRSRTSAAIPTRPDMPS